MASKQLRISHFMAVAVFVQLVYVTPMKANETKETTAVLKARYKQVAGADVEHGQGAIERNELPHREIETCVWLIRVPAPADLKEWQRRLNSTVDSKHGSFVVEKPTAAEQKRVENGEIKFQQ